MNNDTNSTVTLNAAAEATKGAESASDLAFQMFNLADELGECASVAAGTADVFMNFCDYTEFPESPQLWQRANDLGVLVSFLLEHVQKTNDRISGELLELQSKVRDLQK